MKQTVVAKQEFLDEILNDGEAYAGIILGKKGQADHHLILLPGKASDVSFEQAQEFASKLGGELPTRREQSLLYANLKEEFEERAYWSGEKHSDPRFAWSQGFTDGLQDYDTTNYQLRARAVRRIVIE